MIVKKALVLNYRQIGWIGEYRIGQFPNKKTQNISFRAGYNPNFHLRNDYLDYKGGNFDFLGFDDGTRAILLKTIFQISLKLWATLKGKLPKTIETF